MWRLALFEQARNIRVIILTSIWPQSSNKPGKPGRGKIITWAIECSEPKGSVEQFLPVGCRSSSFGEAPRCLSMVPYKNNECRLLDGSECSDFVVIAVLLTFIHKCKPSPGKPLAERGVSHGHFSCSRPPCRNQNPLGRYNSIAIAASHINFRCIRLTFTFLNAPQQSSKGRLRRRWEVADLVSESFRSNIFLGVYDSREVVQLTTESDQ